MEKTPRITLATTVTAVSGQISSDLEGETIILDANSGKYYGLEGIAVDVWEIIQQPTTVQTICDRVTGEYEVEQDRCQADIVALLESLASEGLVVLNNEHDA